MYIDPNLRNGIIRARLEVIFMSIVAVFSDSYLQWSHRILHE